MAKTTDELTLMVLHSEYDSAHQGIRLNELFCHEQNRQFCPIISQRYLWERQLEWTTSGHGIQRSFRFWSPEELTEYLPTANQISAMLKSIGVEVLFGFGAVLAYVRDGDFIPHDDGLDLIVAFNRNKVNTLPEALNLITIVRRYS